MNTTIAPTERHIHVDLDVDREHRFHYRSQGRDGHRVVLHRGDSVTFTCSDDFSVRFEERTPFEKPVLYSRHSFITAHVRDDAPMGTYEYTVEVRKGEDLVADPDAGHPSAQRPQIVIA